MNRFILTLITVAFLTSSTALAANEIAIVDLQEIFKQFYKTKLAQDQMRQQADDIKTERDKLEQELATLNEEIETLRTDSRDETLSEVVRSSKRDLLEEKLVEMQTKEQEMTEFGELRMKQMDQQNQRMTKKLVDEIHESINNYAKVQGYIAVIDRSAQSRIGTEVVLYTSPKVDITADVLALLNEGRDSSNVEQPNPNIEE